MAFCCLRRKLSANQTDVSEECTLQEHTATKTTPDTEQVPAKKFDQSEFKAFQSLLRDRFFKTFNVRNTDNNMVTVYAKDPPLFSDAKGYFENFRKDEMNLSEKEMTQLMNYFDETSFLPNGFAVPVRDQNKVTIYSFRYNEFKKIKHQIEVKCGREMLTRDKSKQFENAINLETSGLHVSPTRHYVEGGVRDFTAKSGIKVSVYKADITQLMVDAIVNTANERLQHEEGVAASIASAAGVEMEIEGDDYVKNHGCLNVTDVVPTTPGLLKCSKVFHAVGPRWSDYHDKCLCQELLEKTVFNCLKKAHDLQFTSIAVSSISSAIFGVPEELCARMYLAALQRFEREYGSESKVRHIHFVDISDEMVSIIQDTFSQLWDTDITLTEANSMPDPPARLQTNEVFDRILTIHASDKRYEEECTLQEHTATRTMPDTEQVPAKKFDQSEFKAFQSILGDRFSKTFNVKDTYTDDMVTVYAKDPPLFSDAKGYFENFRKDEMNLSEKEMTQLMNYFDETSFLPNGFVVPVRDQNKVTIYSFRYNEFKKIKHQIEVKCGREMLTRDKSKQFENAINLESSSLHVSPTRHYVEGGLRDFTAKSGIKVSVYKADITQLMVDAIVNTANERLQHEVGVAASIASAAGVEMEIEGDDYVKNHGCLNVTDVVPTTPGLLKCSKVFHAVVPRWRNYQDKRLCQELLEKTVFNCLKKAQDLQFTSIAMSSISSAIFGVPKELCARMYLAALQRFEREYGSESKVRHIHFVDFSDEMVSIIQDTFSQLWDTDITLIEAIAKPDPPARLQIIEVFDRILTIHTSDKDYDVDAVIYCNEQNISSGCENEKQKDEFSFAGGSLFFLDLQKIREIIKDKVLQTLSSNKGTRIVFPAMSRDLISEENMRAITERFISKMDPEHTKALTVLIIPYQTESNSKDFIKRKENMNNDFGK